jgi:hypothetical protein
MRICQTSARLIWSTWKLQGRIFETKAEAKKRNAREKEKEEKRRLKKRLLPKKRRASPLPQGPE